MDLALLIVSFLGYFDKDKDYSRIRISEKSHIKQVKMEAKSNVLTGGYYDCLNHNIGIYAINVPEEIVLEDIPAIISHETLHKVLHNHIGYPACHKLDAFIKKLGRYDTGLVGYDGL